MDARPQKDLDLTWTYTMLYNKKNLEATQLNKYSRRPILRRSSLRLLNQTRRNSFACRAVKYWNRVPLAVPLVPFQRTIKNTPRLVHLPIMFNSFILFSQQYGLFGQLVNYPSLSTYIKNPLGNPLNMAERIWIYLLTRACWWYPVNKTHVSYLPSISTNNWYN